jgi:ZIP family zinc transporter
MLKIIIFSGLAGIVGTSIGGFIGLFFGKRTDKTISRVLTFASGIMVSIALFNLMPEAYEISGAIVTAMGVLLGVLVVFLLNYYIDKKTQNAKQKVVIHSTLESLHHQEKLIKAKTNKQGLLRAGIIMLVAIALHNIPEGMAIGASGVVSINLSFTLAILLAVHNIPEGMAIAVPLSASGIGKVKITLLVLAAGATTILGGVLGAFVGSLGGLSTALSLSFAAGAMLYVTFCEILPQSTIMEQGKVPALFSIFGILFGFIITTLL